MTLKSSPTLKTFAASPKGSIEMALRAAPPQFPFFACKVALTPSAMPEGVYNTYNI